MPNPPSSSLHLDPSAVEAAMNGPAVPQPPAPPPPPIDISEALSNEGFPTDIAAAFQETADVTNCVVMSRAPGGAVTKLVEHGHDLKSYQIKAKSCDWGPMRGFLCQLTCLNKAGQKKIAYNDEQYVHYFDFYVEQQDEPTFAAALASGQTPFIPLQLFNARKQEVLGHDSIDSQFEVGTDVVGIATHSVIHDEKPTLTVVMEFLLQKSGKTPTGEDLWAVYHGRVFIREPGKDGFANFMTEKASCLRRKSGRLVTSDRKNAKSVAVKDLMGAGIEDIVRPEGLSAIPMPDGAAGDLDKRLTALGVDISRTPATDFYPLCVAQNPYPPYALRPKTDKEDQPAYEVYKDRATPHLYKNAVTGDYDVFAVWPMRTGYGWEEMLRASDMRISMTRRYEHTSAARPQSGAHKQSMFLRVATKPYGLELRASPNVFIEIIPDFDTIGRWEDPTFGNINASVATAAQMLNSIVFAKMLASLGGGEGGKQGENGAPDDAEFVRRHKIRSEFRYGNMAFHSDEGGRPGIDEIDLPVGVFIPKTLVSSHSAALWLNLATGKPPIDPAMVLGETGFEALLRLALAMRNNCIVTFNHVWISALFAIVCDKPTFTKAEETKDVTDFFKNAAKARALLVAKARENGTDEDQDVRRIKRLLTALFIGGQLGVSYDPDAQSRWGVTDGVRNEAPAADEAMDALANAILSAVAIVEPGPKRDKFREAVLTIPEREPIQTGAPNA